MPAMSGLASLIVLHVMFQRMFLTASALSRAGLAIGSGYMKMMAFLRN